MKDINKTEQIKIIREFLDEAKRFRQHNISSSGKLHDHNSYGSGYDNGFIDGVERLALELFPELEGML